MRILIADEEAVHRFLLEKFLKKWGFEVIGTDSGSEAWQILCQDHGPRIAILGWQLPGMDGIEICREMRRIAERPYTYILMLSARAQQADIQMGLAAGADDYLTKPYSPRELQGRVLAARKAVKSAVGIPLFRQSAPGNTAIASVR